MLRIKDAGFALYEVLLGLAIFAIGVIALGRAVSNCVTASGLSADDARVRQILANRMAEVETAPAQPDPEKEIKIDTGHGIVRLFQKAQPEDLKEETSVAGTTGGTFLTPIIGISRVTLTAQWTRGSIRQSKQIAFYVYRPR
jgi:Tfp pilus assembly protein PilV